MADNPSDYQPIPSLPQRLGTQWLRMLEIVRRGPYLTTIFAVLGAVIFIVITWRAGNHWLLDTPENTARSYEVALSEATRTDYLLEFFHKHWLLGFKLMVPALLLAWVRQRGRDLLLALTLLTVALLALWLGGEIATGWEPAHNSMMGEVPSPQAFYWKLGLISATFLSVPFLFWLYHRSPILDRYLVRSFLAPFGMCLLGIIAIWVTMDLLNNTKDFIKVGFGLKQVLNFYFQQLPQILVMIMDAVVLLATLYTLSRMSRFNEMLSMLGSGRSLVRILVPIFIIGGWATLLVMAMNYAWAPGAQAVKDAMLSSAEKDTDKTAKKSRASSTYNVMFRNREEHRTWFLGQVPAASNARDLRIDFLAVVQDDGEGNLLKAWYAKGAKWVPYEQKWRLFDAHIIGPDYNSDNPEVPSYEKYAVTEPWQETPWSILSGKVNPDFLSVPELTSYLKSSVSLEARKLARYESTLHSRFSLPFRSFLMVLLAAPLGIVTSRRGVLGGVAWSVILFVIVYFLYTLSLKFAEGGYLSPALGAWGVVGLFSLLGMGLLWMKNYNRPFPNLRPWTWFRKA